MNNKAIIEFGFRIDPMQKWPPLIFVTEKNYLLTEIYYFTVKIRSKGITV